MNSETDGQLIQRLGDDAAKWAAEFRRRAIRLGYSDMDEGWLIGWFANAIEGAESTRRYRHDAAMASQWRGVVARGYCDPHNSHKELDSDLLEAIVVEIMTALARKGELA